MSVIATQSGVIPHVGDSVFKPTENGLIPEDWDVARLGDLTSESAAESLQQVAQKCTLQKVAPLFAART